MTDRYERIREALKMGPTPGPRRAVEQSVIGPQDLRILSANVTFSVGINGSHSVPIEEAIANAALAAACDPDTIRALLEERDQLAAALAAAQQRIACLPADWREDSSLETWFPITAEEIESLRTENARLREDAERYRWLRDANINTLPYDGYGIGPGFPCGDDLDATIDAAMSKEGK